MLIPTTDTLKNDAPRTYTPQLQNGDHLTHAEFERRYEAMPETKKAELIEGVVYIGSPVRIDQHAQPHLWINGWLFNYMAATQNVTGGDNATLKLDPDNMPQPDCVLFIKPEFGGKVRVDAKGYISGSPELVAEVAASTVSIDVNEKLKVYRRNGVNEYLIWRVEDAQIDWLILRDGVYVPLSPGLDGILRSETFPGLWLNPAAMLHGHLATVLRTLNEGIQSREHAEFTQRLT